MNKELTPSQHSEFSPSGSGRWIACPGSIQAIRQLNIENKPNIYAEEGTAAHELAAKVLEEPSLNPHDFIGKLIYTGTKKWYVDAEMANAVEEYQGHVLSMVSNFDDLRVETRVSLEHLYAGTFGTADAVIVDKEQGIIRVIDYKHGRGVPVEAKENSQLQLYAIGTLVGLHEEGLNLKDFHTIELHIVQPRCPHPEGPIRIWYTTVEELQKKSKEAKQAIINACSDDPDFEAGEKQCQWCDFSPMCKVYAEYCLTIAQNEFNDFIVEPINLKEIPRLSNEQISNILQHSKLITNWINSIVSYAQTELEKGNNFPNYKLVRGRSNRIWTENAEDEVIQKLLTEDIEGVTVNDLYNTKFKTPAQLEKTLGKNKSLLEEFIIKPEGKITIAPNSDKRPPVSPTADAENEFSQFAEK